MTAGSGNPSPSAGVERREGRPSAKGRFAQAVDLAVVALILGAYGVAATGGVRWEFLGLRLSVSSPSRAVLAAALLVLLRRWRAADVPLHPWLNRVRDALVPPAAERSADIGAEGGAGGVRRPGEWAAVVLTFVGLTLLMTWQQVAALHSVSDIGDPLFSVWRLSWVAHQLPRDPLHLFDANIFYPELRTLAYSDAMLATALIAAPLLWAGVHQVVAYNIVFLASFAAAGVAMYALVRELTGDRAAAMVSGVAFAFYPFRFEHYSHLELQVTFWTPLALLMLHRTMKSGRVRDGAATGLMVALQALSSLYCGLFLLVVMGVVWAWSAGRREAASRRIRPWLAAAAVVVVLVLPITVPYLQNRGQLGERPDWEARLYSATPASYLVAHTRSRLYADLLDGPRQPEASLFPGIGIVALALVGAWPRLTTGRAAYAVAALVAFDGSLGLNGIVFPTLRDVLLPFRGLRVPARFSMLVGLSLSVLAGYGIHRLRQSSKLKGVLASAGPVACAALLLVENVPNLELTAVPAKPPLIYDYFTGAPTSVLVDLPFPESLVAATGDSRRLYYSTFHWQTLVTGSSGYFPESFRQAVRMLRGVPTARSVAFLQERGVEFIALDRADCPDWEYWQSIEYLDQDPRVELVRRISGSRDDASLYRILPR
jgi:hypothetical protein